MPKHFLSVDAQIQLMLDLEEQSGLSIIERLALERLKSMSVLREAQDRWSNKNREIKNRRSSDYEKRKRAERGKSHRAINEEGELIMLYLKERGPCVTPSPMFSQRKRRELVVGGYLAVITDHGKPALNEYDLTEKGFAYVERLKQIVQQ